MDVTPSHATNTIVPTKALGAGIDRLPYGAADKLFNDATIQQVLSAGWQTVTYRQNTELHIEAWHWNPQGTWSDPAGKGYFHRKRDAGVGNDPALVRLSTAASRGDARRRDRYGRVLAADRRRRGLVLEEQSVSVASVHRRRRCDAPAMGVFRFDERTQM